MRKSIQIKKSYRNNHKNVINKVKQNPIYKKFWGSLGWSSYESYNELPLEKLPEFIQQLEEKMKEAAKNLEFEEAAKYRDKIKTLRDKLLGH